MDILYNASMQDKVLRIPVPLPTNLEWLVAKPFYNTIFTHLDGQSFLRNQHAFSKIQVCVVYNLKFEVLSLT